MHALAATLHCTVAHIERGMSAREFAQWCAWMAAERIGPAWDRLRHAQLLAAVYGGPAERKGGGTFKPADFMGPDPWEDEPAAGQAGDAAASDLMVRLMRAERDAMEEQFGGH